MITTDTYEVRRLTPEDIIIGMEPITQLADFISDLDNLPELLEIVDSTGNLITDYDTLVSTGMMIKLVYHDLTYDYAYLIVRGDIDGNGMITTADLSLMASHLLGASEQSGIYLYAMELNQDEAITTADFSLLASYLLEAISSLN